MRALLRGARGVLPGGLAALLLAGCAKISSPIGGEPDQEPPRVVATNPEPFAVVPGLDQPVVIKFDERISERRVQESVMVSPETGAVRVKKGRSELRVSLEGGWRPGMIYRVVVLPVLQDLFNNPLQHEIELIFSTGPEIPATAVAGLLTDRITGQPATGARVEALSVADSVVYVAMSDTAGFFALRHIPAGSYELRAYLDRNQSRKLDYGEPESSAELVIAPTDTAIVSYALLAADTTAARVARAEARDSMQIRITLDDHLDPLVALDGVQVELRQLPDSTLVPGVAQVLHLHEFERLQAEQRAAEDSAAAAAAAAADSVAGADSAVVAADSTTLVASDVTVRSGAEAMPEVEAVPEVEATPDTVTPLPARELVVIPAAPLVPKARYLVTLTGVRNINGVEGGGGTAPFEVPAPVVPDSTSIEAADSTGTGVPDPALITLPDTVTGVRPDTSGGMRPDTAGGVKPGSAGGVRPDSAGGMRPDPAGGVRPDSATVVPLDTATVVPPASRGGRRR